MTTQLILAHEGKSALGGFVLFKLFGEDTGGSFALVEHVVQPGQLAAPRHTHQNEDEYSYVLEGVLSAEIGGEVIHAPAGSLVSKPRHVPHTFWNQGTAVLRLIEIISPAGFERYFEELEGVLAAGNPPDLDRVTALAERYGLTMEFETVGELMEKYGVGFGEVEEVGVENAISPMLLS